MIIRFPYILKKKSRDLYYYLSYINSSYPDDSIFISETIRKYYYYDSCFNTTCIDYYWSAQHIRDAVIKRLIVEIEQKKQEYLDLLDEFNYQKHQKFDSGW